jgi:NAD-dependent oxidoreductase involved in siderophore biosynthesis
MLGCAVSAVHQVSVVNGLASSLAEHSSRQHQQHLSYLFMTELWKDTLKHAGSPVRLSEAAAAAAAASAISSTVLFAADGSAGAALLVDGSW